MKIYLDWQKIWLEFDY